MARHEVVSPIPGVFYRRPDPDSDPFAAEGQTVGADDTVCLVEVMKSFHQVPAGAAGTVVEFLVENEDVVDAGQPVAVIEASADGQG
jgi:acetyl-CoA carboxylase biotin carboxyl carrier protein